MSAKEISPLVGRDPPETEQPTTPSEVSSALPQGAAIGTFGGPIGIAAGTIIGGIIGGIAGSSFGSAVSDFAKGALDFIFHG
ncbi:hypothetical protein HMPREF1317_1517 [Schaalia georgiae F0490]|uniref:Uncharacterized protein n=1 Tax=Schaalia georgiae F0490 TaxID=1125717 RepID=J1HIR5_9ACTO|nr:hypothetical protein HMPREF1317_1517 [Schaalia georgiae F0490]